MTFSEASYNQATSSIVKCSSECSTEHSVVETSVSSTQSFTSSSSHSNKKRQVKCKLDRDHKVRCVHKKVNYRRTRPPPPRMPPPKEYQTKKCKNSKDVLAINTYECHLKNELKALKHRPGTNDEMHKTNEESRICTKNGVTHSCGVQEANHQRNEQAHQDVEETRHNGQE